MTKLLLKVLFKILIKTALNSKESLDKSMPKIC